MWFRTRGETTLVFSVRHDGMWEPERGVGPNAPHVYCRLRPSLYFDGNGRAWLTWTNQNLDNSLDVASSFWEDSGWSPEVQVNTPDVDSLNAVSQIACGGGQVWCVWSGARNSVANLSVYASRWNGQTGRWGPKMQVSPANGNCHWWTDVAVDSLGRPQVVWCETERTAIRNSYYDGLQWVGPFLVNDSSHVRAASYGDPHIALDRDGILHVSYTGVLVGTSRRDIFYARNDGTGWMSSVRVTHDTLHNYDEWYSDIAADSRDNVWIAWERQDEEPDQFRIYAVHFDGRLWSPEQRLDDSSAYYDESPAIALDTLGFPCVAWDASRYGSANDDVYFNHVLAPGAVSQNAPCAPAAYGTAIRALMTPTRRPAFSYTAPITGVARLDVFDRSGRFVRGVSGRCAAGTQNYVLWDGCFPNGKSAPTGIYICRLWAGGISATCSFVLLSD